MSIPKNSFYLTLLTLLVLLPIGFLSAENEKDSELPSTVSIEITEMGLQPEILTLTPGTTVVWENRSQYEVRVKFVDNAVATTCKAPKNFALDKRGIFESDKITNGDVASLCFLEKKDYRYEVEVVPVEREVEESSAISIEAIAQTEEATEEVAEIVAKLDLVQKLQGVVTVE